MKYYTERYPIPVGIGRRSVCHSSNHAQADVSSFKSGDWVQVTWSSVERPAIDDMVALYAPAGP